METILGVPLEAGGVHPRMGTHNALLSLGHSTYLEVLAIDPSAPDPGRQRWFELDRLALGATPRLCAWVARTERVRQTARECPYAYGAIEAMSRGSLQWLITVPPDGALLDGGAVPYLIEWLSGPHPAATLPDRGCTLGGLELHVPDPDSLAESLGCLGLQDDERVAVVQGEDPFLAARIQTLQGVRLIGGPELSAR